MPAASGTDSKPNSAPASKPSSIKSHNSVKRSPALRPQDALPEAPSNGESPVRPAEKASVKDRLKGMFSSKEPSRTGTPNGESGTRSRGASINGLAAPATRKSPSSEKDRSSGEKPAEKPAEKPVAPKAAGGKEPSTRFTANPDVPGGHEHVLKSSRRQEKLSDMWRSLIGKKQEPTPESDLSLVSNWVDSLRQEKEDAAEKKGNVNVSSTLVEKYGKCQEIVGRGAFGIVRISHKKLGAGEKLFAVKEFRRRPEETEKKYSKRLTAEFCISSSLRHPNVIHTLDLLKDAKGDYCEVMEFCAGGDLYTLILSSGKLEVQEADCFFKQMMRGVEYLHEMGVAHRDLKPENLLLTTRGALKITDFGNGECFRMAWETDAHMVSGLCGSAPYISPEEYTDKEFDARAVDVWACGVIYMAMRTGRHLWRVAKKDEDEFYGRYLEGRRDEDGYGPIESLHRVSFD